MRVQIRIPTVPSYLIVNGIPTAVNEFTNEDLKAVGDVWIANLVKKARGIRTRDVRIELFIGPSQEAK